MPVHAPSSAGSASPAAHNDKVETATLTHRPGRRRWSLSGQLLTLCSALTLLTTLISLGVLSLSNRYFPVPWEILLSVILLICLPIVLVTVSWVMHPLERRLRALNNSANNLSENDFSTSIASGRNDEIGDIIQAFNQVSQTLRDERRDIFQRELLLDTVLQSAPLALVLSDLRQRVIYSNPHARQLFFAGRKLEGYSLEQVLEKAPGALREALANRRQGLISLDQEGENEIYHLARQTFMLNARPHELWLIKPMTRELNRQEVATWKKVIRVISHELNNSLAPIASLANSGLQLIRKPAAEVQQSQDKLELIFTTIAERSRHLHHFIEAYARFARLPRPQKQAVDWQQFLAELGETQTFQLIGGVPEKPGYFDPTQLQQALINLLKNAHEAGSAPAQVGLSIITSPQGLRLQVLDRGNGISPAVLANAVLPFYSTKKSGSGLGLALCREIMEAHDGRLAITQREGGGTCVSLWLPHAETTATVENRSDPANPQVAAGHEPEAASGEQNSANRSDF